jgi:hypothetical protein
LIGSLNYLSILTRPDISYAVSKLSQFLKHPGLPHFTAAMQVFRYLNGTMYRGLHFQKQDSYNLRAFIDSDWGNCPDTRRSHTGFLVLRQSHLISWKSTKQSTVSLSSTEAEYKALADACKDVVWIQNLSSEIFTSSLSSLATVHVDNRGAINLALSQVSQNGFRTKHMDLRLHFVQDLIAQKLLKISFVRSSKNISDFLTKPVGRTSILRAVSSFAADALKLAALCSQAQSMSACQDTVSCNTNVADAFMHAIRKSCWPLNSQLYLYERLTLCHLKLSPKPPMQVMNCGRMSKAPAAKEPLWTLTTMMARARQSNSGILSQVSTGAIKVI